MSVLLIGLLIRLEDSEPVLRHNNQLAKNTEYDTNDLPVRMSTNSKSKKILS